jgi:NTP pyrophosphatase (non-canonical NTP hydrolase)
MDLNAMAAEVREVNEANGWHGEDRPGVYGLLALLHSEVSEALEAYRTEWGLEPWVSVSAAPESGWDEYTLAEAEGLGVPLADAKPEGVGSELADVLIRWLDMSGLLMGTSADLDAEVARHLGVYGMNEDFASAACIMHMHISRLAFAVDEGHDGGWESPAVVRREAISVLRYLVQWAEFLGIDLEAEYRRKIAWNRTRPYRHGGKKF